MYEYRAKLISVYDGDTITVDIDLGLEVWLRKQKLRLYGINAPEMRGREKPRGEESKQFLIDILGDSEITLRTHKDRRGKYGRWLAELIVEGQNVNELMVEYGYAISRVY